MPRIRWMANCPPWYRLARYAVGLFSLVLAVQPGRGFAQEVEQLAGMSLDSLLNIRVSAASRYEQVARMAPASTVIVTAEAIRQHGYQTLGEVLEDVAGFYTSYDRNYTYIGVRGFGRPTDYNNRILVLLDGQRLNEGFYGATSGGLDLGIDLRTLDRIEIVRGPGSAVFGTSAMFAVINLVPAAGAPAGGWLRGRLADLGTRGVSASFGGNLGGLELRAAGSAVNSDGADLYYPEFDDPETNDGVARGMDWERTRTAQLRAKLSALTMMLRWSDRDKGLPTGAWGSYFNDPRARTSDAFFSADARLDLALASDKQFALRARTDTYIYDGWYPVSETEGVWQDRNDTRSMGVQGMLTWDQSPNHRLLIGSEADWYIRALYQAHNGEEQYFDGDFPFRAFSVFAQSELHVGKGLRAFLGLREDWSGETEPALSPRLALILTPDSLTTLKLLWGQAFRSPNVYEREYYTDDHRRVLGLDPEYVRTQELVLERRLGRSLIASASLFRTHVDGLIDLANGTDSLTYFRNVQSVHSQGGELELIWRAGQSELRGSYSLADAEDASSHEELTNSPHHLLKARLGIPLARAAQLGISTRCESGRTTVQETRTGSACLTGGTITVSPVRHLELSFQLRNALNAVHSTPAGWEHRQAAILQDGRSLGIEAQWRF